MFGKIQAHRNIPGCDSYTTARHSLAVAVEKSNGKRIHGDAIPLAAHSKSVTSVRQRPDESIAFRLYDTDVVTWHPDDSVTIRNFGTNTTTDFAYRFLPRGFYLAYETTKGGNRTISFPDRPRGEQGYWADKSVCEGAAVRFEPLGAEAWAPDPATVSPLGFPELDRRVARTISAEYHLSDFNNWLAMAPLHIDLEHHETDLHGCAQALRERNFAEAVAYLPLINVEKGSFGRSRDDHKVIPVETYTWREAVTWQSFERMKLWLWAHFGAFEAVEFISLPATEFERRMKRVRQLATIGQASMWGPKR